MEKKYYQAYRDIVELFISAGLNKNQSSITPEDVLKELRELGKSDPESWKVEEIREQLQPYLDDPKLVLPSEEPEEEEKSGCAPSGRVILNLTFIGFILIITIFAGWKACNM